ncbi:MAG: hypothetical protein ACQES4_03790 [Bacillota bacterium]
MQLLVQGLVFFVVFGSLWYVAQTKNIFGLGARIKDGKEAALNALLTSCIATVVFVALLYFTGL